MSCYKFKLLHLKITSVHLDSKVKNLTICPCTRVNFLVNAILVFSMARFSRKMAYLLSRKNLANESLRNCDVRQVLCIKTFSAVFKPKNVCIFAEFSTFQSFQSEIILVKCCKEVSVLLKLVFIRIFRV